MKALTSDVVTWLRDYGANIVGVSNVERFDGAPRGHHPSDFVPGAKSVITFGVALLHYVIQWEEHLANSELVPPEHRKELLQNYFYRETGYNLVNNLLNRLALGLSNLLENEGYLSLFFPATYGPSVTELIQKTIPAQWGVFSQRHAAVMAGLGEFGLNNVVVTPQYGPRIRFNSVITEAELVPSPLLEEKTCLGESCSLCLQNCPGAISLRSGFNPDDVWYITPAQTNITTCRELNRRHYCLGRCIKVCPVAKKTPKGKR